MAEHGGKKDKPKPSPSASPIGFIIVIIIIAGILQQTSWGKKLLQDPQTATTTGSVATSAY
ncbi:MAG: hypothetical protein A3I39_01715 [Candidatus Yanofskybacteria bacterium RIFCSPLOWO2_02_FULL_47_9b]|uniref:Uncharacterized protein n=1 Tax=Candidatus Yanofskybacteria bacterium RIFCSPLOWO2_02_FULL_47_9b TaxID=1802708 RepID=A0A1F8HAW8_9BACT|nr:MAG: hypothetical protein A3I39_01715 [Candidatus Yanofskybacteria bacterium RIFCSPLOWO2_02_FULL_47_9b]